MKTWFITGASRGFGYRWTAAALARGDRVAATARDLAALDGLVARYGGAIVPLRLDVTDRAADFAAVAEAHARLGRLDVVVNNAGYGQFGMIEELTEQQVRAQLETNLFGAFWVTQAALPIMRAQGGGHVIQVSSIGGVCAFAEVGAYNAAKWALEGFSEALSHEVAGFGIRVTIVEPSAFVTDFAGSSAGHATPIAAYDEARAVREGQREVQMARLGDPAASAAALFEAVDADDPPLRLFLGGSSLAAVAADYATRLATWRQWQPVAVTATGSVVTSDLEEEVS
ncbi:MAG: SDR family NAD(P)-dependent oxidoreductase [Micrococcales bacterium]|nr:SDR family NAD(P)-dependent oxidoreductase [Micrococcales bacterium]